MSGGYLRLSPRAIIFRMIRWKTGADGKVRIEEGLDHSIFWSVILISKFLANLKGVPGCFIDSTPDFILANIFRGQLFKVLLSWYYLRLEFL
jgi:hypothetical protein